MVYQNKFIDLIAFVSIKKITALNIAFVGDKEFIRKLTEITLANLENEAFGGKELSRETAVSVTFLNKRLIYILKIKKLHEIPDTFKYNSFV